MTKFSTILALVGYVGVANAECPNACSGHGECGVFDQCSCYRNWQSNDCSQRTCPFGHAHVDTPKGDLNMDGGALSGPEDPVIINSEVYPLGTTEQYPDAQDNEAHFYMECSNKGLCDRKSGNCKCFDGYDGASCQRASCPGGDGGESSQCSGRGTCHSIDYLAHYHGESHFPLDYGSTVSYKLWDAGYTRGCLCDPPFAGADCASRQCKFGVDPLYVSTGTALYQKAFVVNSCQNGGGTPNSGITTNGDNHAYEGTYDPTPGVRDNVNSFEGVLLIPADAIPNWAVAGAEVIVSNTTENNHFTNVGCRYTVVDAMIDPVRLYVKASGETANADLKKCGVNGIGTMAGGDFLVYHVTNTFTLLFTDHFGQVHRTAPISAAVADYSDEIKAALEGLPNRVVGEVVVKGVRVNPQETPDDAAGEQPPSTPAEMAYEIEFISNPGKLNGLQIDSTPIRLGQTLQAGIECEFDQEDGLSISTVYSKVGYSEIGEDSTSFGNYVGNVGYFRQQEYLTDDNGDNVISGRENEYIYTASDLTSVLEENDVIKIKNEIYVVDEITKSFIRLNTWFKGDDVQGISTQLKYNDEQGEATTDVFTIKKIDGKLHVVNANFSTPAYNSNNERRFNDRKGDFAQDKYIRISSANIATDHVFDCIFLLTNNTVATYGGEDPLADDTLLENVWSYQLTVVDEGSNCPSLSNAFSSSTNNTNDGIPVKMYQWDPTGYTNGRYADKTRIFKMSGSSRAEYLADVASQQGANTALLSDDIDADCVAGRIVLYGNEINVIKSCTANEITFNNAIAMKSMFFAQIPSLKYDHEKLFYLPEFGEPDSSDYTYVSQCSNRGVCDGVSGVCKCFKGYTGDNCNTISELFG